MYKVILAIVLTVAISAAFCQQLLSNESVLKMVRAGLSDEQIAATINANPGVYDSSAQSLNALKSAGAGKNTIAAIITKGAGFSVSVGIEQPLSWHDPSKLLGITRAQFRQFLPSQCKKLKPFNDGSARGECFINGYRGHVDDFLGTANGATLIFDRDRLVRITFSTWHGSGTADSLVVRYGPYDAPGRTESVKAYLGDGKNDALVSLDEIGNHEATRLFWTKDGYGIILEGWFKRAISDAMAFNPGSERIRFVMAEPLAH